jgi:hypothetical protein
MTGRTSRRGRTSTRSSAALSLVRTSSGQSAPTNPEQLQSQYQYVVDDLKRIGFIAAVLIAGLVGLSFFLK